MVILIELCLLQNKISKSELIQLVLIPKSCEFIKTITVCTFSPLRLVYSHMRCTRLSGNVRSYTNQQHIALPPMNEVGLATLSS